MVGPNRRAVVQEPPTQVPKLTARELAWFILLPIAVRLALVPIVRDFEADAYQRMELTARVADALRHHLPLLPAMYVPVWPPAWHLVCALVEQLWPNTYYVPKVLAALFGGLTPYACVLIARELNASWHAQRLTCVLVTFAPLHLMYSTSGMTEAFYGFWFVMAALCFLRAEPGNFWLLGSGAALILPCLTRFDSWILLLALLPMAWLQRRATLRTSLAAALLVAAAPLTWFGLVYAVTGDPRSFFREHSTYLTHFYQAYKYHALYGDRGPLGFALHAGVLICTVGGASIFLAVATARRGWRKDRTVRGLVLWLSVSFAYLFLLWLLRRQVGWRRHYLAIGCTLAPLTAIGLARLTPRRRVIALLSDLGLVAAFSLPFAYVPLRYAQAATFVRNAVAHDPAARVYCDEPGVRIISQLPKGRFVVSAPPGPAEATTAWLRAQGVRFVVYAEVDYSPLGERYPFMRDRGAAGPFQLVYDPPASHAPLPRVHVYALTQGDAR
jgi:hypothetical protein